MTGSLTYFFSIIGLIAYFSYITVLHGTVGFLVSVAIFLILSSFLDHVEYTTIGLLIIGLSLSIYVKKGMKKREGFVDPPLPTEGTDANATATTVTPATATATPTTATATPTTATPATPATATPIVAASETDKSTPASSNTTPAIDPAQLADSLKDALNKVGAGKDTILKAGFQNTEASGKADVTSGFQGPTAGLFKLGELPSEMKKGPFIDTASTITKAMNALQPEQMAAMTAESQSLMETQKNLMGMLQSMRPVLQDGRQLLDTFSGIFGGLGGLGGLAGGKVEGKA